MASSADMSGPRRQMASMFQAPYPAAASLPGSPSSLKHLTVKTSSAGLDGKPAAYAHPYSYLMQQASLPSTSEHFGGQSQASLQGPGTSLNNTSDQRSSQDGQLSSKMLECILMSPTRATGRAPSLKRLNSLLAQQSSGALSNCEEALVNNLTVDNMQAQQESLQKMAAVH